MDERRIEQARREATDTEHVVIGEGVLDSVADVFERSFGDRAAVVIGDENTIELAGAAVGRTIQGRGREPIEPFVSLPPGPRSMPTTRPSGPWCSRCGHMRRFRWRSARERSTTSSSGPHTSATALT